MGTLTGWIIAVPSLLIFVSLLFVALFVGVTLAGGSPIPPWNW
jgi:hypothetical protein